MTSYKALALGLALCAGLAPTGAQAQSVSARARAKLFTAMVSKSALSTPAPSLNGARAVARAVTFSSAVAARPSLTRLVAAMQRQAQVSLVSSSDQGSLHFRALDVRTASPFPLRVEFVLNDSAPVDRVLYMVPGGSVNFQQSFFTPANASLASYMAEHGAFVVGVTQSEDNVAALASDYSVMADWGFAKHREDLRIVTELVRSSLNRELPCELLGMSFGAYYVLDYAAHYTTCDRVLAVDIGSLRPDAQPGPADAERTYQAEVELIANGTYVNDANMLTGVQLSLAETAPQIDSGISRQPFGGVPGNFTALGAVYYAGIASGKVPGPHTPSTGLPGDWLLNSIFTGTYTFAPNPVDDRFEFSLITADKFHDSALRSGSGLIPLAIERDYWAVNAGNPAYRIDWGNIRGKVVWFNAELGYGSNMYGAELIRAAGHAQVTADVLPRYGHGDLLLSSQARTEVWPRLLPQ